MPKGKVLHFAKTFLLSYGIAVGTTILLLSWIVEKYQASYWDQQSSAIGELRTHAFQELILAQSNAMFLTRKAEAQKFLPIIETNQDVVNTFQAHDELIKIFSRKLPSAYHDGLSEVNELINRMLGIYRLDYEQMGQRVLSEEEAKTVGDLNSQVQSLISIGEGAMANETFYQAGLDRLQTLQKLTYVLEDRKDYDDRFSSLIEDMRKFADSVSEGKPSETSVTALIDQLYSISSDVIQDIHGYAEYVTRKKYRYAAVYRFFYILGSITILVSMVITKRTG
jgi:hypothetical protein